MKELYLLRHAATSWNQARRIQGHADLPLTDSSIDSLVATSISPQWHLANWVTSPLARARQTATHLGVKHFEIAPQLVEMHWGEFEGLTLDEINRQIAERQISPPTGRHFRPPSGESPAEVAQRLIDWVVALASSSTVAVTHKGVIRAALSVATGWDMTQPFGQKIDWSLPHKFCYSADGGFELKQLNCPW